MIKTQNNRIIWLIHAVFILSILVCIFSSSVLFQQSENINWVGALLIVTYGIFLIMQLIFWIWEQNAPKISVRIKFLVGIFTIILTYYTTDGRFITKSAPQGRIFGGGYADRCGQCNYLTWLDKLLFRRCYTPPDGPSCRLYIPEGNKFRNKSDGVAV